MVNIEIADADTVVADASADISGDATTGQNEELKRILEALLMAAEKPLNIDYLARLLMSGLSYGSSEEQDQGAPLERRTLKDALQSLVLDYQNRGIELVEVASGYRFQVRQQYSEWTARLWEEKPQKYSRALLETLALIAYRQPITRGDIEQVRGVAVSTGIMKTLQERNWVKVIGHREVPGRPSIYGTTKQFLDYFNLRALDQLPPLTEIRDLEAISNQLSSQLELDT